MGFSFKATGIQETISRLQNFDKKLRRSTLMKAGRAGAKPIKAAMIQNAPLDATVKPGNTWRKSIGTKVKVFGTAVWFAVGPRSAYTATVKLLTKFFRGKDGRVHPIPADRSKRPERFEQKRRPVLYSHLAEKKHGMIARTKQQTQAASVSAMRQVMEEAVGSA